jgi:hypothetical protein
MIATDIATYLAGKGHGIVNTDLFSDFQPDEPDNCIVFYNESAPSLPESDALAVDQYGLQVLVRNTANSTARSKILDIHRALVGFSGELSGQTITDLCIVTPPTTIGRDEHNRAEWSAHYRYRLLSTGDEFRL